MKLVVKLHGEGGSAATKTEATTPLLEVESDKITRHVAEYVTRQLMERMTGVVAGDLVISDEGRTATVVVQGKVLGASARAGIVPLQQTLKDALRQVGVEI